MAVAFFIFLLMNLPKNAMSVPILIKHTVHKNKDKNNAIVTQPIKKLSNDGAYDTSTLNLYL